MGTIKKEISITGNGLMKNKECHVLIKPSTSGKIKFYVKDSTTPIVADVDHVTSTSHCVCVGNGSEELMLIEHFMAACAFCNIQSIDVYTSEAEMPILDGSSLEWINAFKKAGIEKSKEIKYTLLEPVSYLNGKTHVIIVPDEKLRISYGVNYDHPDYRQRWAEYDTKNDKEIIEARTFGFLKDLKKYQFFGYAKGVTVENTVGFKDDGGYTTDLRSDKEPIKHKILDIIGDLYLTGVNPLHLKAQIVAKEAGHAVHVKTALKLRDKLIKCE
ncbi:MAG: UDP-3-O-acyl-N-acetylglucosamine deacetylase [Candidatus Gastranaerophilaceae bacterium]